MCVLTINKHIVVHTVSPQTPERTGELSITRNVMLINTNIKATSDPNLPGYDAGGIKKVNQLSTTIIPVGIKSCAKIRLSFLITKNMGINHIEIEKHCPKIFIERVLKLLQ